LARKKRGRKKMTQLQEKIESLADQQNHIATSIYKHGQAINAQAAFIGDHQDRIQRLENAIENIMGWIGRELGEDAVQRLREHLGVPDEVVCEHEWPDVGDKMIPRICPKCGSMHPEDQKDDDNEGNDDN
jgi:hypothetical protein